MYQPTHGFSSAFANKSVTQPMPALTSSTTVNDEIPINIPMMGGNSFLRGKPLTIGTNSFPRMKIVAPDHDSAVNQG